MFDTTPADLLISECARLGLELPPDAPEQFARYAVELADWNQRMNLTSITDPIEVVVKHFVDSLTGLLVLPPRPSPEDDLHIVDIGAGAGFPGLAVKLARPSVRLTLMDSVGKKTTFLRHMVEVLGLTGVEVITGRAEDMARLDRHRERFDVALGRAVAALPVLMELMLPLVRVGGIAVAWKRGAIAKELWSAEHALSVLGGRLRHRRPLRLPGDEVDRLLLVFEKIRRSPDTYPRRAGVPAKTPL